MEFIHLNVHSHYSKGWGVGTIEDLCRAARDLGMNRLALTDTNGLYGLVFFVQTARKWALQPIVGSELVSTGAAGRAAGQKRSQGMPTSPGSSPTATVTRTLT